MRRTAGMNKHQKAAHKLGDERFENDDDIPVT